ncbi:Digeranylgeranylglyceryl phosphate synthase [Leucoagaricus sp. SymC.cos]|nr:Digeranylgeranylglyceryl phosphate synthase [Leucoagaricus sp. SymC.cos]
MLVATQSFVTAYLFTRSDFITSFTPVNLQITFAIMKSRSRSIDRIVVCGLWTWLHLLAFCVSNQLISVEEDIINKSWRPLPSGRISISATSKLRWLLVPICLTFSLFTNAFAASVVLIIATFVYNEMLFHHHWASKTFLTVIGYGAFITGSLMILSEPVGDISIRSIKSLSTILLVLFMTIHAGDFPDVEGDKTIGRQTFPVSHPTLSRYSLVFSILLWSLYPLVDTVPAGYILTLNTCFGVFVAARYGLLTTSRDDKTSSVLYYVSS